MSSKHQNRFHLPSVLFTFASHFACYLHHRKAPRASIMRMLIDAAIDGFGDADIPSPSAVEEASITVADLHYGFTYMPKWAIKNTNK